MNVALVLPLLITAVPAQSASRALSLREALQLADTRSPELREAELAIPVAQAGVSAAGQLPNPTVGVSYGADEPKLFETLETRLPVLGQRGAAIAAARAEIPIARAELATRRLAVRAQVRRAYAALAQAQARLQRLREAAGLAQTLGQMAQAKFDAGTASQFEVEQAQLAARRADNDVLDAAGVHRQAQATLATLLAIASPENLEATDPLWPVPVLPEHEALSASVARHPEVVTQLANRDAALARAHLERMNLLPMPVLSLEVQHFPVPELPVGFRGGIAFDLPLLSWNQGAIEVQQALAAQASAAAANRQYALTQQLEVARLRFDAAARQAKLFHEQLIPSAQHVVELAQVAYQLGRTPLSNVLQAQADLARSLLDAVDADTAAWNALADLEEASGVPF